MFGWIKFEFPWTRRRRLEREAREKHERNIGRLKRMLDAERQHAADIERARIRARTKPASRGCNGNCYQGRQCECRPRQDEISVATHTHDDALLLAPARHHEVSAWDWRAAAPLVPDSEKPPFHGGGGTFSGGGASGDWDSSFSSSSSDSSSSDSSSSDSGGASSSD